MQTRRSARLAGSGADVAPPLSALQSLAKRREFARRLLALPLELLRLVLRAAGCPTRLVCRQVRHAYGPLPCALLLPRGTTPEAMLALRPRRGAAPRFGHVHTLYTCNRTHLSHTLPCALARAFPNLRSLAFPAVQLTPENVRALGPLSRTLIHLATGYLRPNSIAALAQALPSLRALHFLVEPPSQLVEVLGPLAGRLPHLVSLEVSSVGTPAALLLQQLAGGLPHLTRLRLDTCLRDWNSEAAASLASTWPQLAHLCLWFLYPPAGAAAAVAHHTALTYLSIMGAEVPDCPQLSSLPLCELHVNPYHDAYPGLASSFSTLTRLGRGGYCMWLSDAWAGALLQLRDSLLSLKLEGFYSCWGHLTRLSCLSKLQDPTLVHDRLWHCHQELTQEQAATVTAAGLSSLQYLHMSDASQRLLQRALVACLGVHGRLRELFISEWDPRWPVRLQALAGTLVRLTIGCWGGDDQAALLISSLKGLTHLRFLHLRWSDDDTVDRDGQYGAQPEHQWVEGIDLPGRRPAPPELDATVWPEWGVLQAGARAAAGQGGDTPRVWLPPQLKVLLLPSWHNYGQPLRGELREAARRKGCVIWEEQPDPYPAERDDCEGYEEGATTAWLRRPGRL